MTDLGKCFEALQVIAMLLCGCSGFACRGIFIYMTGPNTLRERAH
jgi:hypothetical protein